MIEKKHRIKRILKGFIITLKVIHLTISTENITI